METQPELKFNPVHGNVLESLPTYLIFELSAHNHVVANMVKLSGEDCTVFTVENNIDSLVQTLKEYDLNPSVRDWTIGAEMLKLKEIRRYCRIIVTTWHESTLTKRKLVLGFNIVRSNFHILCIRNGVKWRASSYLSLDRLLSRKFKLKEHFFAVISFLLSRFMIMRAKRIVVESRMQLDFMKHLAFVRSIKMETFPGRLSNFKPVRKIGHLCERSDNNDLVLGFLGTCNEDRRDINLVNDVISSLSKTRNLRVIWLGGVHKDTAKDLLIRNFPEITFTFPSNKVWSEHDFFDLSSSCNFLVSPLNYDWGYNSGMSTGSLADAIALEKKIFYPNFVNFGQEFDDFIVYYRDCRNLCNQIIALENSPESQDVPSATSLANFSIENVRKMLFMD